MSDAKDLSWLLGTRDSVAALEGYYGQVWDKILREVALGLGRPGAAQRTGLLLRLKALVGQLDPYRQTVVRKWIRDWASASLMLGEENAVDGISSQKDVAHPDRASSFGDVATDKSKDSGVMLAGLISDASARLAVLQAQILSSLTGVVTRSQGVLLGMRNQGVLGGLTQQTVERDLADLVLKGPSPAAIRGLRGLGFPDDLVTEIKRLGEGWASSEGSRLPKVADQAGMIGGGLISGGHGAGIKVRSRHNGVEHVRISNPPRVGEPDVCTVFAGRVFFIGLGTDPLGFPKLSSVPNGGPKFHPHCRHGLQPYVVVLKDSEEVDTEVEASNAIPAQFFNVKPYAVTKAVRKMGAEQINRINPGSRPPRKEKVA
jgi:hypothetical protein